MHTHKVCSSIKAGRPLDWLLTSLSMPFPLAHPAAVLPLRRHCPRYFSFPALVIGSLSPDVGYFVDVGDFSHRLLAGSFGFCLPVGLLCVLVFYGVRWPVLGILPAGGRRALLPLCQRPAANPLVIAVSLLIGAWTHLLLDSFTHPENWLVKRLPVLLAPVLSLGPHPVLVCELLYTVFTFAGVAWLAVCYLNWLERAAGLAVSIPRGMKWVCAFLLAGVILGIALVTRGDGQLMVLIPVAMLATLLVLGFVLATGWFFRQPRKPE